MVEKSSLTNIISAASLEASVPVIPMAIPMLALFKATASFTPSPVIPTIMPFCCNACNQRISKHFLGKNSLFYE